MLLLLLLLLRALAMPVDQTFVADYVNPWRYTQAPSSCLPFLQSIPFGDDHRPYPRFGGATD